MTERENLISLLRRQGYERMPSTFNLCPSLEEEYKRTIDNNQHYTKHFNMPWENIDDIILGEESKKTDKFREFYSYELNDSTSIDTWGIGHEKTPTSMHMTQMHHPLRDVETLERMKEYPFPDYANGEASHQPVQVKATHDKGLAAMGDMQCTIWEISWYIRSMEELMVDMMSGDEKAEFILDKVMEMSIIRATSFAKAGVDMLFLGDDIGMQNSIMMSMDLYREWIKPRLKRVVEEARKIKPDLIIFYHSCGYCTPFIEDLIEVGVDVLNPIQSECMDFEEIYKEYGDRISFHGTIGTQQAMPFWKPDEIKALVKRNLDIAGPKGGLLVAPTHLLEPEVPWENIHAFVDACKEYNT